jgi:hypothetical protein
VLEVLDVLKVLEVCAALSTLSTSTTSSTFARDLERAIGAASHHDGMRQHCDA